VPRVPLRLLGLPRALLGLHDRDELVPLARIEVAQVRVLQARPEVGAGVAAIPLATIMAWPRLPSAWFLGALVLPLSEARTTTAGVLSSATRRAVVIPSC
jgi:hypothetical protein